MGYSLSRAENFRRAKLGVLECRSVRPHWGPEREENWDWCGSASAPAASEPNAPGAEYAIGATLAVARMPPRKKAFPFRGRWPRRGRMRGMVPAMKTVCLCRGGCPHPPTGPLPYGRGIPEAPHLYSSLRGGRSRRTAMMSSTAAARSRRTPSKMPSRIRFRAIRAMVGPRIMPSTPASRQPI